MTDIDEFMQARPDPLRERVMAIFRASRAVGVLAVLLYVGGAAVTYTIHFAAERDACYDAGGFLGRIWCPESVATDGFRAYLARAVRWPASVFNVPADRAGEFEQAAQAMKRGDYAEALRIWEPLARNGDERAQYNLGLIYQDGLGVTADHAKAANWYRASAARGLTVAQNSLGLLHRYGLGVEQDYTEAVRWFMEAARKGDAGALSNLGSMYQNGLGVPKSDAEAVKWFLLAAEHGEAESQVNLSDAYAHGHGVRRDTIEAYKWASFAAAQGAERALGRLETLTREMSAGQLAEAERRIGEWQPPEQDVLAGKIRSAMERTTVSKVQTLLMKLGYGGGDVDGIAGPRTRKAITQFQLRDGMTATGEISDELVARLENKVREDEFRASQSRFELVLPTERGTVVAYNCDLFAADYADQERPAGLNGVALSKLNSSRAIPACQRAVAYYPDNPRYSFQLARGFEKAKRYGQAVASYRVAAEQGFVLAQKNLGFIYANGEWVERDMVSAASWLRLAAEAGDVDAQFGLASIYATGRGVPRDEAEAVLWYRKAAEQNHPEAQTRLYRIENPQ